MPPKSRAKKRVTSSKDTGCKENETESKVTKQMKRKAAMGELLRSKGFVWVASSHFLMGGWQQAGNILRFVNYIFFSQNKYIYVFARNNSLLPGMFLKF